ncbi:hypothetical protein [Brevundimonas sp.]|uniref:hypothetical protein n=1 Tax=Brevundimonas sp. TaxID=1871086 RepID=UPI0035644923
MANANDKPMDAFTAGRLFFWMGLGDVAIGACLAGAGLLGVLGEDGEIFAMVGGVMGLIGAGLALWGRHKMNQGDSLGRRRD